MSMESNLVTLLKTLCPRVFPDVAPYETATPYVTFQHIGGVPLRFVDNSATSLRNSMVQINTWAATRAEALTLSRAIEEALCASTAFTARPDSEPIGDMDDDTDRRGCIQDFSIWAPRT
jgi:hypothetical protein